MYEPVRNNFAVGKALSTCLIVIAANISGSYKPYTLFFSLSIFNLKIVNFEVEIFAIRNKLGHCNASVCSDKKRVLVLERPALVVKSFAALKCFSVLAAGVGMRRLMKDLQGKRLKDKSDNKGKFQWRASG